MQHAIMHDGWALVGRTGDTILAGQILDTWGGQRVTVWDGNPPHTPGAQGLVIVAMDGHLADRNVPPAAIGARWLRVRL